MISKFLVTLCFSISLGFTAQCYAENSLELKFYKAEFCTGLADGLWYVGGNVSKHEINDRDSRWNFVGEMYDVRSAARDTIELSDAHYDEGLRQSATAHKRVEALHHTGWTDKDNEEQLAALLELESMVKDCLMLRK